jgi:hypothetical protein
MTECPPQTTSRHPPLRVASFSSGLGSPSVHAPQDPHAYILGWARGTTRPARFVSVDPSLVLSPIVYFRSVRADTAQLRPEHKAGRTQWGEDRRIDAPFGDRRHRGTDARPVLQGKQEIQLPLWRSTLQPIPCPSSPDSRNKRELATRPEAIRRYSRPTTSPLPRCPGAGPDQRRFLPLLESCIERLATRAPEPANGRRSRATTRRGRA